MHDLYAKYGENGCFAVIDDKENKKNPYMLLNIEELYELHGINSSSHCDFIYIYCDDDKKHHIYFVELKNITSNKSDDNSGAIKTIKEKFHQTDNNEYVKDIFKCLNISNPKKYYILVLPRERIDTIKSLLNHEKILRKEYMGGLAPCDGNIREFYQNSFR